MLCCIMHVISKSFDFDGLVGIGYVGAKDFGRFAKSLGGAAMDKFYSDDEDPLYTL